MESAVQRTSTNATANHTMFDCSEIANADAVYGVSDAMRVKETGLT